MTINRRSFIKSTSAGAVGLTLAGTEISQAFADGKKQNAWTSGMKINPEISNTKVVCCYDPDMYPADPTSVFKTVNSNVDARKVYRNLDLMAQRLSGKATADEAWKTIFRSGKSWAETRVAIRVNCIFAQHMNRVAVVKKISDVMVGFGVKPANIVIFDGCMDASGSSKFTPYASLTDTTLIQGVVAKKFTEVGETTAVTVDGASNIVCAKDLVDGNIDILVTIAINKGHNADFGSVTHCMKLHYGTFVNSNLNGSSNLHSTDALFGVNKHDAILGGDPVRQQLCIIDSILASRQGPMAAPDSAAAGGKPCRLIMGTFAPAVDYCCVKKVREAINQWTHNASVINRFLSEFSLTESAIEWDEFTPSTEIDPQRGGAGTAGMNTVRVTLSHPSCRTASVSVPLPAGTNTALVRVFDLRGSRIYESDRKIDSRRGIIWDGSTGAGTVVPSGRYVVRVRAGAVEQSGIITVDW
ncbi:MAG: hypothetical protein JW863_07800 [Chitinispirillaceae bacterium]|nr:hypothetical protein [Chitinispirillaceae bacterium]